MTTVKKNVYYCEFCKKRSLAAHSTRAHEMHCTNNPNRKCRLSCKETGSSFNIGEIVQEFKSRFTLEPYILEDHEGNKYGEGLKVVWTGAPITLKEVRERVDDCPNCVLAIIRQSNFGYHYFEEAGFEKYDYKEEARIAFASKKPDYDYQY